MSPHLESEFLVYSPHLDLEKDFRSCLPDFDLEQDLTYLVINLDEEYDSDDSFRACSFLNVMFIIARILR